MSIKIKKGDTVIVLSGKDKGKNGKVLRIVKIKTDSRIKAVVEGINIVKKHRKPTQENPGKIDEIELPIHISNVAFLDPKSSKPTRLKYEINKNEKIRLTVSSGSKVWFRSIYDWKIISKL